MGYSAAIRRAALVLLMMVSVDTIRRVLRNRFERKRRLLPPGPNAVTLLRSIFSCNALSVWQMFTRWQKTYGDIMYFRVLRTDIVVLNSTAVATDLLEKRSRIYSDRPFYAATVAPQADFHFAFARYGEHWRLCRRIFLDTFRANAAPRFRPMQLRMARRLIVDMMDNPNEYPSHFSMFSGSVALSAVYDYETSAHDDRMVPIVDNLFRASLPGLTPERVIVVKVLPFLLHMPDWLPGSWIKREANKVLVWRNKLVKTPYQYAREHMQQQQSSDDTNASMISDHIAQMEKVDEAYLSKYEIALKHAAATAFVAGFGTTRVTLTAFALAMVKNPHVWKRAQADIDAVVGTNRLPDFDDRPSLPYVEAIIREILRWRPLFPLGAPHAVTQSDTYKGYQIPKGATIFINNWAISRDEARYPDGDKFMPERFLNADGTLTDDDPGDFAFGFGRRRCPGLHIADASIWSAVVTMLATLEFHLAKDADGNDVQFTTTSRYGITNQLDPFPCRIVPRSDIDEEELDRILTK